MFNNVSAASLTLTIPSTPISLDLNPTPEGSFVKSEASTISVKADSTTGYTLNIASKDDNNDLFNGGSKLASIANSITASNFQSDPAYNNQWGFLPDKLYDTDAESLIANTNFLPGPTTTATIIDVTTKPNTSANNYNFSIAAKVDDSLASGSYSNTFVVTATANPGVLPPYMQDFKDFSKEQYDRVLSNMETNTQYEMVDKRDNKTYYVSKLIDGNVWMTEDLDFDLSTSRTLTPEDTDISSNWTPSASTITAGNHSQWSSSKYNAPQSYNPGDKCWNGTISTSGGSNLSGSLVKSCQQHDSSHYYIGNYYNFPAAVAMNDTSSYSTNKYDMNQSICPAGWRLSKIDGDKSFTDLKNKAGFDGNTVTRAPYYFSLDGYYLGSDSAYIGYYGHWRTSIVYSNTTSYHMERTSVSYLNTQDSHSAWHGMTVRCIARNAETKYSINYELNDGTGGPNPNPQTGRTDDKTIKLSSSYPSKDGYGFAGWCTEQPDNNNTSSPSCGGTIYQPGSDYPLESEDGNSTLYAIWNDGIMQNWSGCSSLTRYDQGGPILELTDSRDGNKYKVAKLKDEKCWMIDNLRLGSNDKTTTITSENSDSPGNFTLLKGNISGFTANTTSTNAYFYLDPTYGGYYSWYSATAGTGVPGITSGNATHSICPKGWRLPTSGSGGDFEVLVKKYGNGTDAATSTALRSEPVPGFKLGGDIWSGSISYKGTEGYYMSSTSYDYDQAYFLRITSSSVYSSYNGNYEKDEGKSVRCIVK